MMTDSDSESSSVEEIPRPMSSSSSSAAAAAAAAIMRAPPRLITAPESSSSSSSSVASSSASRHSSRDHSATNAKNRKTLEIEEQNEDGITQNEYVYLKDHSVEDYKFV